MLNLIIKYLQKNRVIACDRINFHEQEKH